MSFFLLILIYSGIYALMAIGQNLITGYGGMLSLCQAGFYAIGSYTTAILTVKCGWSFWATLPVAMCLAGLCGLLIGLPTLRLKGDYLAIATLGFGEIVRNILNNWDKLTNGPMGIQKIPMVEFFGMQINPYRKTGFIILVWTFVFVFYILYRRFARSRMGRALTAVREDEIAAASMGINVTTYKVIAFVMGAAIAGLAGSFFVVYTLSVTPGSFTFMVSIMVLCMVVLGGMGNFKACILGAFIIQFISYFPELTGLTNVIPAQFKQIIFGLILVVMMIWRPQGILGRDRFDVAGNNRKKRIFKIGKEAGNATGN